MIEISDELMFAMYDRTAPRRSGELVGEYLVSAITRHPRYPRLTAEKDAALLERAKTLAANIFRDVAENTLPKLGFDARSIEVYQTAALKAFRDALPMSNGSAMVH
jgi:hypothetical protein